MWRKAWSQLGIVIGLLTILGTSPAMAASAESAASVTATQRCAACKARAARIYLSSNSDIDCLPGTSTAEEERLKRAVQRCERQNQCAFSGEADSIAAALQQVAAVAEAKVCEGRPLNDSCVSAGDAIDINDVKGMVGRSPAPVDSSTAPTMEAVATFCRALTTYDQAPPLLALPAAKPLPDWCDEANDYSNFVQTCGEPRVIVVVAGADETAADGTPEKPFPSIAAALNGCTGPCHLLVAPGVYPGSLDVKACTLIEGGVAVQQGVVTRDASRPVITGTVRATGDPIVLARLDVKDQYGAVSSSGNVLISDSVLRGGYEGGSSAFSTTGPRICRTTVAGGYGGFGIAWHSSRLSIAGSALAACYEGAALSWGSHGLRVVNSIVYGGYRAIGMDWGSFDADIHDNRLGSDLFAVNLDISPDENGNMPAIFDVSVIGNEIVSGTLPVSDPALKVVVENNSSE